MMDPNDPDAWRDDFSGGEPKGQPAPPRASPDTRSAAEKTRERLTSRQVASVDGVELTEEQQELSDQIDRFIVDPFAGDVFHYDGLAGTGKAQPLDSPVLTPRGWVTIGDLQKGDYVIGSDGKPTLVTGVFDRGVRPILRMHFSDGASVECCTEHLWKVTDAHRRVRVLQAQDINVKKYGSAGFSCAVLAVQPVEMEARDVPVDPYCYGIMLGDAYLSPKGGASITVDVRDADEMFDLFKVGLPDTTMKTHTSTTNRMWIKKAHIEWLAPRKSKAKRIHDDYKNNSVEVRKAVLSGLLDTDSNIFRPTPNRCKIRYSTASFWLATDMIDLVRSLGGIANWSLHNRGEKGIELTISIQVPFNPYRRPRKAALWMPPMRDLSRKIVHREFLGLKPARCISVAHEDHLYVTKDYVLTHNTVVLAHTGRTNDDCSLVALSGKAASLLRRKSGLSASTIHSAIYKLVRSKDLENGKRVMEWSRVHSDGHLNGVTFLLDEKSMINRDIAQDILATGARIVAAGDPGQLPPVKGAQFFTNPNFTLKKIHRQALESPIIRQAYRVREGLAYQDDGPDFRVVSKLPRDQLAAADMVLVWKNDTRKEMTRIIRRIRGLAGQCPQVGEPVMCLKNAPDFGVYNGATYRLTRPFEPGHNMVSIEMDGDEIEIPYVSFEGIPSAVPVGQPETTNLTFGYVYTVHKAQGSEADNVVLIDEYAMQEHAIAWRYTAITRAAKSLTVMRW